MQKERFEILLEEIRKDVKLSLEGHDILRRSIKSVDTKLELMGKDLKMDIKALSDVLHKHLEQPAHA